MVNLHLNSKRLLLKLLETNDLDNFYTIIHNNRERLQENFPVTVSYTKTQEDAADFLQKIQTENNNKISFHFGMWHKDEMVGLLIIKTIEWRTPKCELAYFIDKKFEKQGLVTEGMSEIIKFCFETLGMVRIYGRVATGNITSRNLLERCGFIYEGTLRSDFRNGRNELVDTNYFGLINEAAKPNISL